jgi:predicted peptidase
MIKIVTSIIISCYFAISLSAQDQSAFEEREHQYGSSVLQYRVLYPENFDETKKYPVVLFLHGAGERGMDNKKQLVHGSKLFLNPENRQSFPAIVVFPQCPTEDYWANVDKSVDENGKRQFTFEKKGKPTEAMKGLLSLVDSISGLSHVDTKRLYVMGLSMGGMGTFELVSRRPNTFAAAAPICGGDNPKAVSKYAKKLPFWVFHGNKDDVVLPSFSEAMVAAIKKAGGDVKFTLYPNANHNSWDSAFAEPDLLPWLFSKSK